MVKTGFEFRLCPNGLTYLWKNGELVTTSVTRDYITLEQDEDEIINLLNELDNCEEKWEKKYLQLIEDFDGCHECKHMKYYYDGWGTDALCTKYNEWKYEDDDWTGCLEFEYRG